MPSRWRMVPISRYALCKAKRIYFLICKFEAVWMKWFPKLVTVFFELATPVAFVFAPLTEGHTRTRGAARWCRPLFPPLLSKAPHPPMTARWVQSLLPKPACCPAPPPPTLSSFYDSIFTCSQLSHHLSSEARDTGCCSLSYLFFLSLWLGKTSPWAPKAVSVHSILSCSDSKGAALGLFISIPVSLELRARHVVGEAWAEHSITGRLLHSRSGRRNLPYVTACHLTGQTLD